MTILISLLPILIVMGTTLLYAYFFGIGGTIDEIILATLGLVVGPLFMFLGYHYFNTWGIFVSIVVMLIGFTNICIFPKTLVDINKIRNKPVLA